MDWFLIVITILSLLSSILAWLVKLKWSKEYKEAKEAQISALNEKLNHHKEISSLHLLEYFKEAKIQFEENLIDIRKKLDEEKKRNKNQVFTMEEYREKVEALLNEKEILIKEVHYRVKNNLAVISGMAQLQSMQIDDIKFRNEIKTLQKRIRLIALLHEKMYESESLTNINLNEIILYLIKDYDFNTSIMDYSQIDLSINQCLPVLLALNELFSNFKEKPIGKLSVGINQKNNLISICFKCDYSMSEDLIFDNEKDISKTLFKILIDQLNGTIDYRNGVKIVFEKSTN